MFKRLVTLGLVLCVANTVLMAGNSEEQSINHVEIATILFYDGKYINTYSMEPELNFFSEQTDIGVFCQPITNRCCAGLPSSRVRVVVVASPVFCLYPLVNRSSPSV